MSVQVSRGGERVSSTPAPRIDPCPECACGKCRNCDGTAWDFELDELGQCPCDSAGHAS